MKKIKMVLTVTVLVVSVCISAQTNSQQSKNIKSKGWSSVYLQYNPMTLSSDYSNTDDCSFNGFTFGFSKAHAIADDTPFFMEVGGALTATFYSDSYESDKSYYYNGDASISMISFKVPVNLLYKLEVSNSVSILPYVGLTARFNIVANEHLEFDNDDCDDEDYNLFDKKDMGSKDATWKRLQLGYQIGTNVMFNDKWHLGLAYGSDFSEICKKTKFSTTSLTIGLDF